MQLEFSLFIYLLSEHISVYQSVYCFLLSSMNSNLFIHEFE